MFVLNGIVMETKRRCAVCMNGATLAVPWLSRGLCDRLFKFMHCSYGGDGNAIKLELVFESVVIMCVCQFSSKPGHSVVPSVSPPWAVAQKPQFCM